MAKMSPPSRILLASCNSQHYNASSMWDAMTARNASTFIWAGDAIYGDDFPNSYNIDAAVGTSSSPRKIQEATPTILSNLYNNLLNDPGYMRLTGRIDSTEDGGGGVRVLGVLDDHDYGTNNGDRTYQHRIESAKLYVEFLQASSSSSSPETRTRHDFTIMERRAAAGLGVYGVKVLDFTRPSGQELLSDAEAGLEPSLLDSDNYEAISLSNQSVAIFLLDCRSHKTPWTRVVPDKFYLDYQGDFLGQEQWTWLNASLSRSHATVNIVVQGLQIHADRYFDGNLVENWSRYPMAQHKLYQTVLNSGANAPILVSGDVHMAELLARHCKRPSLVEKDTKATTPRLLLEVTTSGLTHSWCSNICARPQQSLICRVPWLQWALCSGMHWAHWNGAWTELINIPSPYEAGAKRGVQYALGRNFGELEFDWDNQRVIVRILDDRTNGKGVLSTAWDFDVLSGSVPSPILRGSAPSDFEQTREGLLTHGASLDDWICVNHGGSPTLALKLFGVASPISVVVVIILLPFIFSVLAGGAIYRQRARRWQNYRHIHKVKSQ